MVTQVSNEQSKIRIKELKNIAINKNTIDDKL